MTSDDDPIGWDEEDEADDIPVPGSGDSLEIDNELLRAKLGLSEENSFRSKELTPWMENQFLRNIEAYHEADEGPKREIRDLFPDDFGFPPAASMDKVQVREKLRAIETVLGEHGIFLDLTASAPDAVVYEYFVTEVMYERAPLEMAEGFNYHIDGCSGYCPECFQKDFCEVRKEIGWDDEEGEDDVSLG